MLINIKDIVYNKRAMKLIYLTSRSATIELENDLPYYNSQEFDIFLNSSLFRKERRNVFTLFGLEPSKRYVVKVMDEEIEFVTKYESMVIYSSELNLYGDGINDDTSKLQAGIMMLSDRGTLYIEKGTYKVSSLFLKSNMTLYLEKGAKIVGDNIRSHLAYVPSNSHLSLGSFEGSEVTTFASTIMMMNVSDVDFIGEGEIDERAKEGDWYINHREVRGAYRGFGMYIYRSSNIGVAGIYIHNTPSWNLHPYLSNNLRFYSMRIENEPMMPTTDGIDIDCCKDVVIKGNYISVGDDCIAIKSGTYELAKKFKTLSKDIVIENNFMDRGHGGVVFGSESSGGIKNVKVSKCIFSSTDRGLRIKTRRGRGKVDTIDNVYFNNILMEKVGTPFVINMFYNMGPKGGHEEYVWSYSYKERTELTPYIGRFKFSNIVCNDVKVAAGVFLGLPEEPIKEVHLENVSFTFDKDATEDYPVMIEHNRKMKNEGLYCLNVDKIILDNVSFEGVVGKELVEEKSY